MMKWLIILLVLFVIVVMTAFTRLQLVGEDLRRIYSQPPDKWPAPLVDGGVEWQELGILPNSPLQKDSLKHLVELGKALFFDPRLSGSGQISCASCHQPELSWTDGRARSVGHDSAINKRNSPSLQNAWYYTRLFWDGRARDLEDQAFAPINSESEMHGDMRELPFKLRRIQGYAELFSAAYGDPSIDPDRIARAIATFEKTIVSRKSRFDDFLDGDKKALTGKELMGLHVFRTKAGCMNCHHGPLFTDNKFHNSGFSFDDAGLYNVTHKDDDKMKFRTPSLRDVMKTGPWMHDGGMNDMGLILEIYRKGVPGADSLIKPLRLSGKEMEALAAFLHAISSPPVEFKRPALP